MIMWLWGIYEPLALGLGVYLFQSLKAIYIIQTIGVAGLAFCYFFILSNRDWKAIAESIHSRMKVAEVNEPLLAHELLIEDDEDVFIPQWLFFFF